MAAPAHPPLPPASAGRAATLARPTKSLVAGSVLVAVAAVLTAVALLVHLHDTATNQARQTLTSLDIVLTEQTKQALDAVDLTLKDTLNLLVHKKGAATAANIGRLYGGADVHDLLRAEWGNTPQIADITIFDSKGQMVSSSGVTPVPDVNVAFRPYFQRARDNRTPATFLGGPITFQRSNTAAILLVRRLDAPDGSFAGLLVGVISLDYFTNLYHDIYLGPGTGIALFRLDGLLLARYPSIPAVGKNLASEVVFTHVLARNTSGVIHGTGKLGGKPLFIATHALPNFPLAVNVIMTDHQAYADWRNELIGIAAALGLILGMIAMLTVLGLRHFSAYAKLVGARLETTRAIEARARAEAMTQAKSRFLANMSHELRTPLNAVIGFSEIIETAMIGPLQQRYREYARDIRAAGTHLLEIVNDILDLSKAEANALKIGREPLDVGAIVREVDRIVRDQVARAHVAFLTRLDDDLPPIIGDPTRLRQILINLVSNALKFTSPGGSVTVSARNAAGCMVIEVSDNGIGMAAEDIPTALTPFEQLDNGVARKHNGTGLGLPLTKHLVELLGGRFSITSAVNQGTTVAIEFDCQRRAA
ncbi:MAG: sensor histidine kinase [Stellaceae bacterium]